MTTAPPSNIDGNGRSLARNFSVLMGSQVSTFLITIAATVIIPRYLGAEVIGQLQLAAAIWAMGVAIIGFGMDLAITKAVARDPKRIGHLWATGIVARLIIAIPVSLVLFSYAFLVGYDDQVLTLLVIFGVASIVQSAADVSLAALMGLEQMGAVSASAVIARTLAVVGAIALLLMGFGVYAVAIVTGAGSLVSLVLLASALRKFWREIGAGIDVRVERSGVIALLRESQPYFWVHFFMIAYQQVDIVVISLVVEDGDVLGWYSVYDRLAGTLMFVPTVFIAVIYPSLSRLYGNPDAANRETHNVLTARTFKLMLVLSVPSGFALAVIARPLIELVYGDEFSNASEVVAIGGVVISLTYLTTIFAMFLISMDKEKSVTIFIALGAILTIPLDMYLVPFFQAQIDNGAVGGVVAYAITESVILTGVLYLMPKGALGPSALAFSIRVVAAGAIMAAAMYPLRQQFLPIPIAVGAVVFVLAAALLRLTTAEDRQLVVSVVPDRFLPSGLRQG